MQEAGGTLRYEHLAAWDARGRDLPAWMEPTSAGLRLVVDTAGAVGAVTIDPVLPGAAWSVEGQQSAAYLGSPAGLRAAPAWTATGAAIGERLGAEVASAGDVNSDGYLDVLAGSPNESTGGTRAQRG